MLLLCWRCWWVVALSLHPPLDAVVVDYVDSYALPVEMRKTCPTFASFPSWHYWHCSYSTVVVVGPSSAPRADPEAYSSRNPNGKSFYIIHLAISDLMIQELFAIPLPVDLVDLVLCL